MTMWVNEIFSFNYLIINKLINQSNYYEKIYTFVCTYDIYRSAMGTGANQDYRVVWQMPMTEVQSPVYQ